MDTQTHLFIGASSDDNTPVFAPLKYANRHGLVSGATGTGKTVTMQILAEGFSRAGVPVFLADVKGDVSGMAAAGSTHPKLEERAQTIGLADYSYRGHPLMFWDLFQKSGHPVRATVSDMGPLLISRMLQLNEVQEGVLNIAFAVADANQWELLDFKDLRQMLVHIGQHAREYGLQYGSISTASVGAIQRALLTLQRQGGEQFIGEPALKLKDLMRKDANGHGMISCLHAVELMTSPKLYASFLLWLISELFEELPEAGDTDRPKLVFFFDEAHLLFRDAPAGLVDKIEQVVRLIRSKGVGIYFVTQNPIDVPPRVLGQLASRFQHALRAYTPADQRAVRAAADTFRPNPAFDTEEAITQLGVGEALVSVLEKKGVPSMVQRTLIRPPESRMGPLDPAERDAVMAASPLAGVYDQALDEFSAYEALEQRRMQQEAEALRAEQLEQGGGMGWDDEPEPYTPEAQPYDYEPVSRRSSGARRVSGRGSRRASSSRDAGGRSSGRSNSRSTSRSSARRSARQTVQEAAIKSFTRSLSTSLGRELGKTLSRSVLGTPSRRRRSSSSRSRRR